MFSHHSDQMSQRLKVSKIALWKCSLNVFLVAEGRLKPRISKQIHLVFIWNGGAALQLPPLGICILLSQFLMTTAMLMIKMVCIYYIKMIMMLLLVLMMIWCSSCWWKWWWCVITVLMAFMSATIRILFARHPIFLCMLNRKANRCLQQNRRLPQTLFNIESSDWRNYTWTVSAFLTLD